MLVIRLLQKWFRFDRPEFIFLVLLLVIAGPHITRDRAFSGPDEVNHLKRAHQIAWGGVLPEVGVDRLGRSVGGTLPAAYRSERVATAHPPTGAVAYVDFRNTVLYQPILYLVYVPAIVVSEWFNLSIERMEVLARTSSLIAYALLMLGAIALLPSGKRVMLAVGLTPFATRMAAHVSFDVCGFAAFMLLVSACLRMAAWTRADGAEGSASSPASLSVLPTPTAALLPPRWLLVVIAVAALLVASWKPCYTPALLLPLLGLPTAQQQRRARLKFAAAIVGVGLVLALTWAAMIRAYYAVQVIAPTADPDAQGMLILQDPINFISVMINHLSGNAMYWSTGFFAVALPPPTLMLFLLAFIGLAIIDADEPVSGRRDRAVLGVVVVVCVVLIELLMYMAYTNLGANTVMNSSPRYFAPLMPLLLLGVSIPWGVSLWRQRAATALAVTLILALQASMMPQPNTLRPQGQNPQGQKPQGQNPPAQNPPAQNPPAQNPQGQNLRGLNPQGQSLQGQIPQGQSPQGQNLQGQRPPG